MPEWANVAGLVKAKDREGGLLAQSAKGLSFLLREGMEVAFVPPVLRIPRTAKVASVQEQADGRWLVRFDVICDRNTAQQLVGHYCLVRVADLPEGWDVPDTLDVAGFTLLDSQRNAVGQVVRMEENPAHPLLVVSLKGREALVPLVEDLLIDLDEESRTLQMELPEGLLDL